MIAPAIQVIERLEAVAPRRVEVDQRDPVGNALATLAKLFPTREVIGLYYGNYTGATSVLKAMVFGKIAGEDAARLRNSPGQLRR